MVQYIELFKVADEDGEDNHDSDGQNGEDSFAYFSDLAGDPYYGDSGSLLYFPVSMSERFFEIPEDPFCAEVLDLFYSYSSSLDEEMSYTFSSTPSSSSPTSTASFSGGYDKDVIDGHGTWTAGIAAGSISDGSPYLTQDCHSDEVRPFARV